MLDFKKLENALENQIVRTVAAVGVLLLIGGIFESILFHLFAALESTLIFDGFWNLTYLGVFATLVAGGLWAALAVTRSWEQPWWMIVLGAFAAWALIIAPGSLELPNFLMNVVLIIGDLARLAGALLAVVLLDKAIPRAAAPFGAGSAGGGPAGQVHGGQGYGGGQGFGGQQYDQAGSYDSGQYQAEQESAGGTPPGWYPDPHGEATSRWWDGNAWSNNVR
jgi:hypothetical protein